MGKSESEYCREGAAARSCGRPFLRSGNILRLVYPRPFFGAVYFYSFALVLSQKFYQFVAVDPDLMVTFFLGFVKDQFQAEVEVGLFNIVGVFFGTVAGTAHIADDIPGLDETAFF